MMIQWEVSFPAPTGEEPRRAYLWLPDSYETDEDRRYPVLYMFDGHNVFFDSDATYGKCWGMKEFMEETQLPLIIAAVECNHSPDGGRLSEYSPFTFFDEKLGSITGRGRQTMEWILNEFKPSIDEQYRTLPDREHTFIAGSSMGGLMSLYAITRYNRFFSRAAALSPSIWFATNQLERMIRTARIRRGTVLYMDYGSNEMRHHKNMAHQFGQVSSLLYNKGIWLESRIVPHGDHCEASWERQLPFFLQTLLYDLDDE